MSTNIVFIDARVAGYQTLIAGLTAPAEVFVLDSNSDGVNQIAALLHGRTEIDALHIVSHGSAGSVYLGNSVLDNQNLSSYTSHRTRGYRERAYGLGRHTFLRVQCWSR